MLNLRYTGHPLIDIGVATICAFTGKGDPSTITEDDLDIALKYMEENYPENPLKSYLTVAFLNSRFTNPAFEQRPDVRKNYVTKIARSYKNGVLSGERCVFTGDPAVSIGEVTDHQGSDSRGFRQHIPLTLGENCINFYPYGDSGLPVGSLALIALHAMPMGCAKIEGCMLGVHSDDQELMYSFARKFLETNRKNVLVARMEGSDKLPNYPRWVSTALIETLIEIQRERMSVEEAGDVAPSVTAYHLSNSGQGVKLDIYPLPSEIVGFIRHALTPKYLRSWNAICERGWQLVKTTRRSKHDAESQYNVVYEDLVRLPDNYRNFIRRYFLRTPQTSKLPGDPRSQYSLRNEAALVSWDLCELFLKKVVQMEKTRIDSIREMGDRLARYVVLENDRRFFFEFLTARRYDLLRSALLRASVALVKAGKPPLVDFDSYISVFEFGEGVPLQDWRLARDLVLVRVIERLYAEGWLQAHTNELPELEQESDNTAKEA